ncbi:MAG TPA: aromatic-ring-hydroxylating dioxygenase subunit beta [Kofleriaceae bacterium]|nr:aromatic-ring-hydroxylating dioxygenase subunit beta [Kofleriaceae bacterium]
MASQIGEDLSETSGAHGQSGALDGDGKPGARLAQDIVIENAAGDAAVGAEAIAPDHVPRTVPSTRPAAPAIARPAAIPSADALREIEQLLYRQSELLDGKLWQDYIDLFADDGVYWMPVTPEQTEWEGSPSIFAEDKYMMQVRMGRVTHPTAWSQVPMWATSHVIGNVVLESESGGEYVVRSRFHMMELRRDTVRHFGGTYRHTLVRTGGQLKIKLQRVDMFNAQAPYDYVLQVWV